jgi:hypothetical protein
MRGSAFVGRLRLVVVLGLGLLLLGVRVDLEWLRGLVVGRLVMHLLGLRDQGAGGVIVWWVLVR